LKIKNTMAKTVVITGANAGIGFATALGLASKGYRIVTICRDAHKGADTIKALKQKYPDIEAENFSVDLSDLEGIKPVANNILAKYPVIDRLINNAGYYPASIEYVNDVEKTFVASHLGHMLLTLCLMPALERSSESRVINFSSGLHSQGRVNRFFKRVPGMTSSQAYGDAKLANVLFTMGLAKRLPKNVTTYALHPGVVSTNFAKGTPGAFSMVINVLRPFFLSPQKGAATSIYLADAPTEKVTIFSGQYFDKEKPAKTNNPDVNSINAEQLWQSSAQILSDFKFT